MHCRFKLHFILCWLLFVGHNSFVVSSNSKETYVQVAEDVQLHTLEYGDSRSGTAPVVLMLHGFPDLAISWQYHAQQLAKEGYFVITPDMRGFGSSSIPSKDKYLSAYSRERLVADIDSLRKHYCGEDGSFSMLVGHDWGGVVVWAVLEAFGRPSSMDTTLIPIAKSAVIVNAPHPRVFSKHIYRLKQSLKSWYIFCFQLFWWPEFFLQHTKSLYYLRTKFEYQYLVDNLKTKLVIGQESSCSAEMTTDDKEESSTCSASGVLPMDVEGNLATFKRALTDGDRIHAMLSYYRAMTAGFWSEIRDSSELSFANKVIRFLHNGQTMEPILSPDTEWSKDSRDKTVSIPTLILWGKKDRFLGEELASPPDGLLENFYGTKFIDADHWVHWGKPDEVLKELIDFANSQNKMQSEKAADQ